MDKLEGTEIKLGGKTYTMPELPYMAYEEHDAMTKIVDIARSLDAMKGNPLLNPFTGNTLRESRELIMLALKENYPDLQEDELVKGLHVIDIVNGVGVLINTELKAQQIVEEDRKNGEKQTAEKA